MLPMKRLQHSTEALIVMICQLFVQMGNDHLIDHPFYSKTKLFFLNCAFKKVQFHYKIYQYIYACSLRFSSGEEYDGSLSLKMRSAYTIKHSVTTAWIPTPWRAAAPPPHSNSFDLYNIIIVITILYLKTFVSTSANKRLTMHKCHKENKHQYLRRFGAHTMAKFLECIPVSLPNAATFAR